MIMTKKLVEAYVFAALGATYFIGWVCYKGMVGKDEDMYRNAHLGEKQRNPGDKASFDSNAMMMETLKRGGASDLG